LERFELLQSLFYICCINASTYGLTEAIAGDIAPPDSASGGSGMKPVRVPKAAATRTTDVLHPMLAQLRALVDQFGKPLPFASEWAAMNRLRGELGNFCEILDASLGAWEIRRNGMRVMKLEVICGDSGMGQFNAKRAMEDLKLKDEAQPVEWTYGPVEFYVHDDNHEHECE
jgi:hypothetical protein